MKILLYTLEFPPFKGGVANYYGSLVANWPERNNIFVLRAAASGFLFKYLRESFRLCWNIKRRKIKYLLVGQILPLGSIAYFCSFICSFRYAVFFHGTDFSFAVKRKHKAWLTSLILRRADKIICANSYVARLLSDRFPLCAAKVLIANPGVSASLERAKKIERSEQFTLLSIGRLVKRKGFAKVIEALPENVRYIIVGSGPEEDNLRLLAKKNNQVELIGEISEAQKWSYLDACDALIMVTEDMAGDFEGFGIVYLEANLAGKPVIASAAGGVGDAVIDGYNGLIVEASNPDSISEAIVRLRDNPELRERLGRQGKRRAEEDFNWPNLARKIASSLN